MLTAIAAPMNEDPQSQLLAVGYCRFAASHPDSDAPQIDTIVVESRTNSAIPDPEFDCVGIQGTLKLVALRHPELCHEVGTGILSRTERNGEQIFSLLDLNGREIALTTSPEFCPGSHDAQLWFDPSPDLECDYDPGAKTISEYRRRRTDALVRRLESIEREREAIMNQLSELHETERQQVQEVFRLSAIAAQARQKFETAKQRLFDRLSRRRLTPGVITETDAGKLTYQERVSYTVNLRDLLTLLNQGTLTPNILINLAFPNGQVSNAEVFKAIVGEAEFSRIATPKITKVLVVQPSQFLKQELAMLTGSLWSDFLPV
jgi:hypothetical protein